MKESTKETIKQKEKDMEENVIAACVVYANIGEHTGHLKVFTREERLQGLEYEWCDSFEQIIFEGTEEEGEKLLADYLKCDSVQNGTYCYSHNPQPRD